MASCFGEVVKCLSLLVSEGWHISADLVHLMTVVSGVAGHFTFLLIVV